MNRITSTLREIAHSRSAADWCQQLDAAFSSGSVIAGSIRVSTVLLVWLVQRMGSGRRSVLRGQRSK